MRRQHETYLHSGQFICECGKKFTNSQAYNGHKTHCKSHHLTKYGNLDFYNELQEIQRHQLYKNSQEYAKISHEQSQIRKLDEITKWISEQHTCEKCGKIMIEKFGSGRFCCRSCANSHKITKEQKEKTSNTLRRVNISDKQKQIFIDKYNINPKLCIVCNQSIDYQKRRCKTCSTTCLNLLLQEYGKRVSSRNLRRSKNEILFCELCEKHFKSVRHNEAIFNGWDADIIIDDYKLAILWNGVWHYKQVMNNQTSSLRQIQNRDKIKIDEIKKCGYIPLIVEDIERHKSDFITKKFQELLCFIEILSE